MSKTEWSGRTTSYSHKFDDWATKPADAAYYRGSAIKRPLFLDVQWTDCPVEVEREVIALWRECGLGNDDFIIKTTMEDLQEWEKEGTATANIQRLIKEKAPEVTDDELIIIHWWW